MSQCNDYGSERDQISATPFKGGALRRIVVDPLPLIAEQLVP